MQTKKSNLLSVIDGNTGKPVKRIVDRRCRVKLDTSSDIRHEVAKLYRETRSGLLDSAEATKLTWILISIQKIIESSDMEARMARLESDSVD
jgi:glycerol kinase